MQVPSQVAASQVPGWRSCYCSPRPPTTHHLSRGKLRLVAAGAATEDTSASAEFSVQVPTADARRCIRFAVVPMGPAQQAIVVEAVAEGSQAFSEAGIQRGLRLTGISDPVRRDEVWKLQDRPSIRYIRDVLRMRSSPMIELQFIPASPELLDALDAAGGALRLAGRNIGSGSSSDADSSAASGRSVAGTSTSSAGSSGSGNEAGSDAGSSLVSLVNMSASEDESGSTMADRLQQQFEQKQASPAVAAYKQRQERRKAYMEQVGQRKDNTFVLLLGASFLLPAAVILSIAWGSGYLDALYSNTMSTLH